MLFTGLVWLILGALIWLGQCISIVDFELAQRLGLQEKSATADPVFLRLEAHTAGWDVLTLWVFPLAGASLAFDNSLWPLLALIGGAIYIDTAGREIAKTLGLRRQDIRTGSISEVRLYFALMAVMLLLGFWAVLLALAALI